VTENAVTQPPGPVDRPLALGEIFAEAIRIYGERVWSAFALGAVVAVASLLSFVLGVAVGLPVLALAFAANLAAAARIVAGDSLAEAWAAVRRRAFTLVVLAVVVVAPFALLLSQLYLVLGAVAWLALLGFAIPVAVMEPGPGGLGTVGFALRRSATLARAEYLHALGVIAALVITIAFLSVLSVGAFRGLAENGLAVAISLTQVVLAPFLFLGLAVLYFDQRARAISSP
jgi:hypothetical protein